METKATLRYLRMTPQKVQLVAGLVRGLPVEQAIHQLTFSKKAAARPLLKLVQSAIANAENNNQLKKDNLFIKKIMVNQGPVLKRWRARAFGRAGLIQKRSSHIYVILDELAPSKVQKKTAAKKATKTATEKERPVVDFNEVKKQAKGKEEKSGSPDEQKKKPLGGFKNIKDKFTRRLGEK